MNRKVLPIVFMLVAGAITCVATYVKNFTILEKLVALLITFLIFYGVGCIIKAMLDYFDKQNEKKRLEEEAAQQEQPQEQEEKKQK
ncbi:MAG: hypothetical protein IJN16_08220 [Lachnospiraceae bacterium]|nr:hypothetical protein [Lachnospiraceae bacterium]